MRRFFPLLLGLLLIGVASSATAQTIRFREVTRQAGLYKPLAGMMGHGGAWGDFDGDGLVDLYVGGFCDRPSELYKPANGPVPNRLFRNLGDGRFEQVSSPAVEYYGRTSGAVFADLDNNGTLEIYAANNAKPRAATAKIPQPQRSARLKFSSLFRNDGGKFVDISKTSGASVEGLETARNIGVFDYNGDGLLDLLVLEDLFCRGPRSVLLKNLGNLKFKDVNNEVGLPDDLFGLGLAVADINDDGRPDFFVGHSNRFFLSKGNKYIESPQLNNVFAWDPLDKEDWPCGAAFGDLNGDGRLDMVLSIHHERARNRIYINRGVKNGVPQFQDVTAAAGLPKQLANKSPHVEIQDFDNDGRPDLYFSTAWLDAKGNVTPLVYRNTGVVGGVPKFAPPKQPAGNVQMVYYPAGPSGDYDRDGRVDLFLINWFENNHSRLLHNESPSRNWLDVQVVGKTFNRMGIGSQIRVYRDGSLGKKQALLGFQELSIGYGYASGQEAVCHFGLGDVTKVDLQIKFPNGKTVTRTGVDADQRLIVKE